MPRRGRIGLARAGALLLAPAMALALALGPLPGCTKGEGAKCTHDTACDFGLACVFTHVAVVDCCVVGDDGSLDCDPNGAISGRGIAPDCELDEYGLFKPRLRRATCLRAGFEEYRVYTGGRTDEVVGGMVVDYAIDLQAIGLDERYVDDCVCERGANFEGGDPAVPYDPILSAPPEAVVCLRDLAEPEPDPSIEPPRDVNGAQLSPLDCPQPPEATDTCPPCVAFPEP